MGTYHIRIERTRQVKQYEPLRIEISTTIEGDEEELNQETQKLINITNNDRSNS